MTASGFYESVAAGKCALSSMTLYNSIFEKNGITSVEEIVFNLRAYDSYDWGSVFADETITLNP